MKKKNSDQTRPGHGAKGPFVGVSYIAIAIGYRCILGQCSSEMPSSLEPFEVRSGRTNSPPEPVAAACVCVVAEAPRGGRARR